MTLRLDPASALKLAKICARFSSNHDGEALNAARMADRLIRELGLGWHDVLVVESRIKPRSPGLTKWESDFLSDIRGRSHLSDKQRACRDRILRKVNDAWRTA